MTLIHRSLTGRVLLDGIDLIHVCWKKVASLVQRKLFECSKLGLVRHRKPYNLSILAWLCIVHSCVTVHMNEHWACLGRRELCKVREVPPCPATLARKQ